MWILENKFYLNHEQKLPHFGQRSQWKTLSIIIHWTPMNHCLMSVSTFIVVTYLFPFHNLLHIALAKFFWNLWHMPLHNEKDLVVSLNKVVVPSWDRWSSCLYFICLHFIGLKGCRCGNCNILFKYHIILFFSINTGNGPIIELTLI